MIKKVAVIGSGVMGKAIAEHIASNGISVTLLDVVSKNCGENRNVMAMGAIEKSKYKNNITVGNLEDDLDKLATVDWTIEVIVENIEIKRKLYKTLEKHCNKNAIISSNTSTILRKQLTKGMSDSFRSRFFITHFFNPPKILTLLEFIAEKENSSALTKKLETFCDLTLGRYIVSCNDNPGFIANRIGCYWLAVGILEAINLNITIEEADNIMANRHIGMPKTGIFSLLDLIGLDVFSSIITLLKQSIDKDDPIHEYEDPAIIKSMINDGVIGRKSNAGFYRIHEISNGKQKQSIDLNTGLYRNTHPATPYNAKTAKSLLLNTSKVTTYACNVMLKTLNYTASLIPEISSDLNKIDDTMRLGYNWHYGPFQLIDLLSEKNITGAEWINQKMEECAPILQHNKKLFKGDTQLNIDGSYEKIPIKEECWMLLHKKYGQKPTIANASASLWDLGDGIACFAFTSKNNCFDESILRLLSDSIAITKEHFKGMIIANDVSHFSVGANLRIFLKKPYEYTENIICYGQDIFSHLKRSSFPVVVAPIGFTVGGGCELTLHCDAIQAYKETFLGLVETNIGVVPGWGGCKEMLLRYKSGDYTKLFNQIFNAQLSSCATDLKDMMVLRKNDGITNSRYRLIHDAKMKALELAKNYTPPKPQVIQITKKNVSLPDDATEHDKFIAEQLHRILGSDGKTEDEVLKLEQECFMELLKSKKTLQRIEHMLMKKKKLHN